MTTPRERLMRIQDALDDDISSMSDAEIRREARRERRDIDAEHAKFMEEVRQRVLAMPRKPLRMRFA